MKLRIKETRWRVTVFLTVASLFNYADRAIFSAIMAPLRTEFGLSDATLGLLGALFLWSYALGSPFAGNLADRRSRSRVVIWSLFGWSVLIAVAGTANGLIMLCAIQVSLGLVESIYPPAAYALLGDHHGPKTRGFAMSINSIGANSGVMVGGAAAGFLAQYYGWRTGYLVFGASGIVLVLISRFFLTDGPQSRSGARQTPRAAEAIRYLIHVPSYHLLLAKQILAEVSTWIFFAWLPLYLFEAYHLKLGAAGFVGTFILQATMVLGTLGGGWVSDVVAARDAARRMMAMAWCFLAAAPFLLVFHGHPGLIAVALAMSGCSLFRGAGTANERPTVCDIIPECFRATAYGLMNTFATASGAAGVLLTGLLKHNLGLNAIFACSSVLYAITGISLLIGYRYCMPRDMARCREYEASLVAPLL